MQWLSFFYTFAPAAADIDAETVSGSVKAVEREFVDSKTAVIAVYFINIDFAVYYL